MDPLALCKECGIPLAVSAECSWGPNGVISSKTSKRTRWIFYESENLDPLYNGIEELIGVPIANIVIASRCRETRRYMSRVFPQEYLDAAKRVLSGEETDPGKRKSVLDMARESAIVSYSLACVYGYGKVSLGPLWESDDDRPWRTSFNRWPYSLPLEAGESLGSCEAFEQRDMWVRYTLKAEDTYEFEYYPCKHPVDLGERPGGNPATSSPETSRSRSVGLAGCRWT